MKYSSPFKTPSLVTRTAIALSALAGSLLACSSESTRSPYESTAIDPTEPTAPETPAPTTEPTESAPDSDATAAPGECKRAAPSNVCGVSPQCGCDAGKTCDVVDSVGTARCVTAGSAPMGHPCTASADCTTGLTCIFGICHAFCSDPTKPCSQPKTGACSQIQTMEGAEIPNLAICRVACEPHDKTSCGGTTAEGTGVCRVDVNGETECQSGGSQNEGETCSPTEECGPGLVCTSSASSSTCKRWCRVGQNDCGSAKCMGFASEINVRGVVYGHCP